MNYEKTRIIVELQSLALTTPVLILCAFVVFECLKPLKKSERGTQMRWILLGIIFGFFGNFVDNLYWMIPWTSNYLNLDFTAKLVNFGVFPNIFFRQFLTALAAYCHLRAFVPSGHGTLRKAIHWSVVISVIIGQAYVFSLYAIKNELF